MKYCVENNLDIFEFHDSEFSFVDFDGNDLVVYASFVNIHKNTQWNPSESDMEIDLSKIILKKFSSATFEPGRTWKTDENGNTYPVEQEIIYKNQEAIELIINEIKDTITVLDFLKEENGSYTIVGCGIEPYFTIKFDCESVIVCWDKYKKKAWYECHRQYEYDVVLHTKEDDENVKIILSCDDETVYYEGKLIKAPSSTIVCKYNNKEYRGCGSDYLWIDTFADLQKQLPENVYLKCCLTCRHGNLCPVGNQHNEIFCTKDVSITQKSDLFYYTEDDLERQNRSRQYCNVCEEYIPQSEEFYTYNDYLYFLKNK